MFAALQHHFAKELRGFSFLLINFYILLPFRALLNDEKKPSVIMRLQCGVIIRRIDRAQMDSARDVALSDNGVFRGVFFPCFRKMIFFLSFESMNIFRAKSAY